MEIARKLEKFLGYSEGYLNSTNANAYMVSIHDLSWHKDDEPLFREAEMPSSARNVNIVSVSFGAPRLFRFKKPHGSKDEASALLKDGDICTMEGRCQDNFYHCIDKAANSGLAGSSMTSGDVRYNLTFRHIPDVKHHQSCGCAIPKSR